MPGGRRLSDGKSHEGVGPQDVALAIIKAVFECGYVNNKVMEFIGDGVAKLKCRFPYRCGRYDYRDHLSVFHLENR